MQSANSVGARSVDIESGRASDNTRSEPDICSATCAGLAYAVCGAASGAASGAVTGCLVKLGQLTADSAGADLQNLPLRDMVISGVVIGAIFGAVSGFGAACK